MAYTKLFSGIVTSTIWTEPNHVRIVWITMLAIANRDGEVDGSVPGLANVAQVTVAECEEALEVLKSPDKYSRTPDNEGRRIEEIDGGWRLFNYMKYRDKMNRDEQTEKARLRKQRQREREKAERDKRDQRDISRESRQAEAEAEAEAEAKANGTARANTVETDTREGGLAQRVRTSAPDFEQVLATAHNGGIPREVAEAFFDSCEAAGWLHKQTGKPLGNWAAALRQYNRNWKSNEQRNGHRKDSSRNAGTSNEGRSDEYAGI